jgi:hypothetical protein
VDPDGEEPDPLPARRSFEPERTITSVLPVSAVATIVTIVVAARIVVAMAAMIGDLG